MYGRDYCNCFKWLLQIITFTRHVTSVLPLMTSKFELVASATGAQTPLCSVDVPSVVLQMAREDMAGTCAMECLKNGCCLLYQFKEDSFLCELFEYTTTNFSVILKCTSQRITMRAGKPVVTQRDQISQYSQVDRSNGHCNIRVLYYIVSTMSQKVVDIRAGSTRLVTNTQQTGKQSQMWYFDEQGYVRSSVNGYGVELGAGSNPCSSTMLGVTPFNVSNTNQWWTWVPASNWLFNQNLNRCFNICKGSHTDNTAIITYPCSTASNNLWIVVEAV